MSLLHLLWICPACCAVGALTLAVIVGGNNGK